MSASPEYPFECLVGHFCPACLVGEVVLLASFHYAFRRCGVDVASSECHCRHFLSQVVGVDDGGVLHVYHHNAEVCGEVGAVSADAQLVDCLIYGEHLVGVVGQVGAVEFLVYDVDVSVFVDHDEPFRSVAPFHVGYSAVA